MKLMEESELSTRKKRKKGNVGSVPLTHFHTDGIQKYLVKCFNSVVSLTPICFSLKAVDNLLMDDRFKVMFENPDYQVDERSEEFRLLNPIVSQVGEKRRKKLSQLVQQEEQVQFFPS